MSKTLSLILPILLPSWRFFKTVEPSPRVHWALMQSPDHWHSYRPRPDRVSVVTMLRRLLWNPRWNQTLYVVSCAERLHLDPNPHSEAQIAARVAREILDSGAADTAMRFRFRLVFVQRVGDHMVEDVVFVSEPVPLAEPLPC